MEARTEKVPFNVYTFEINFQLIHFYIYDYSVYEIEEHNYVAGLLCTRKKGWFADLIHHTCTATILSNNKIVTSANCVTSVHSVTLVLATVNTDEPCYKVKINDDEIHIHPEFDKNTNCNDIAVLELKTALKFGPKVGKIEMVDKSYASKGMDVTILGFSESNDPNRDYSATHLRYIDATVFDFKACQFLFVEIQPPRLLDEDRQFCIILRGGQYYDNIENKFSGGMNVFDNFNRK